MNSDFLDLFARSFRLPLLVTLAFSSVASADSPNSPPPVTAMLEQTESSIDARFRQWGDLGNGTYANPILNGDFADSDVERDEANDRWVMITSTNHYSPGMTLLESKDLVNWQYTGHAIPTITWEPSYNWDQMNGYRFGCWAGDLVQHNGEWLCYQIDFQSGLYLTRANDLAGPWTEPVCLLKRKHWTDPAVYFDNEKQEAWLVCNWGKGSPPRPDQPHEIKLFRLSWDGSELLDEGTTIFSGTAVEAAKIRRFDNQWYIMLIEWQGEGASRDRKQLCLRSQTDSLQGPYESRVVMERETDSDRSACQGSLIEAPDGRWWFMHQLVQNGTPVFHGRPQCLQPVTWKEGWPIIGEDIDGDGIGEPVWVHNKPIPSEHARPLQTSDEFDGQQIGPQWNWNHEPRRERFSLSARPGYLRLHASQPVTVDRGRLKGAFWGASNTLSQRHLGVAKTTATTKLDLRGMTWGTRAGFCHHSGRYALFGVQRQKDGTTQLFFNHNGKLDTGPTVPGTDLYLRSTTDGDEADFAWSLDGESWITTPWNYTLNFGNWRGNRPGVFCWNNRTDDVSESGWVDIDWFHYETGSKP
ncbi:glycoside hydrolase family 43 protein [Rhodopirellula islandica]|nr:glycoside hydrolase 43 family protein [Rhodopirellula islandica]